MTPTTVVAVALLGVVFAMIVVTMALAWRRQGAASAAQVPPPPPVPAELGPARTDPVPATYVSTTRAGDWLDRVVAHGLGARSAAEVQVHDAGVVVRRQGAPHLFLPAGDLVDAHRAPGMAGKYVGGQGLVVLRWTLHGPDGPSVLDTGLRTRRAADREPLTEAVRRLAATATAPGTAGPPPTSPSEEPR